MTNTMSTSSLENGINSTTASITASVTSHQPTPARPTSIQFSASSSSLPVLTPQILKFLNDSVASPAELLPDINSTLDLNVVHQQQLRVAAAAQQVQAQGGMVVLTMTPSDGANNNHNFLFSPQVPRNILYFDGKGSNTVPTTTSGTNGSEHVEATSAAAQFAAVAANPSLLSELGQHLKLPCLADANNIEMQDPVTSTTTLLPELAPSIEDDDGDLMTRPLSASSSTSRHGNQSSSGGGGAGSRGHHRSKLEQKRARNRDAARRCRERKIQLIDRLEKHVSELSTTNKQLQKQLFDTQEEVERLKRFMKQHMESPSCPVRLQS